MMQTGFPWPTFRRGPALEEAAQLQERRQGRLAVKLAAMLEGYAAGGEEEFKTTMTAMAAQLVRVSYGELMLHLIGFVYEKQATEFMTDPVAGMGTWADLGFRTTMAGVPHCTAPRCMRIHNMRTRAKTTHPSLARKCPSVWRPLPPSTPRPMYQETRVPSRFFPPKKT